MNRLRWKSSAVVPSAHMALMTATFLLAALGLLTYGLIAPDFDFVMFAVIAGGWGLLYVVGTLVALSIERDYR